MTCAVLEHVKSCHCQQAPREAGGPSSGMCWENPIRHLSLGTFDEEGLTAMNVRLKASTGEDVEMISMNVEA